MTSLSDGEYHGSGLAQVLNDDPPAGIAALSADNQKHLTRLVHDAVEHETAELVTAALDRLDRVPAPLRRPLIKFLKL